jgi:DNA adenine methylase
MIAFSSNRVTPLLKWAGGKRQLLPALARHYPGRFERYFEPFFGSGAVFFDLLSSGRLEGKDVRLSDVNGDLIGCYRALRDNPDRVIASLERLARAHRERGAECYYDVRDRQFNPMRRALIRDGVVDPDGYTPELAAMLIYLNRTGFNGLFRLNRHGGFNVPAGRYTEPRICDAEHLRRVSNAFRASLVSLRHCRFHEAIAEAGAGDFVYCDPPYEPLSRTSSFASYTADGFTMFDQEALQQAVIAACRRGAHVVVSNSSAPAIFKTYSTAAARQARLWLMPVPAKRAINSRATARGAVDELIISNAPKPKNDPIISAEARPKLRMAKAGAPVASRRRSA